MSSLGFRLVQLIALALQLDKNHFDHAFQDPMIFLRPLHYNAEKSSEEAGVYGAGASLSR